MIYSDVKDVDLEEGCIRKPGENKESQQRLLATDSLGAAGERRNSFVLVKNDGREGDGVFIAQLLLIFRMSDKEDIENR